MPRKEKRERVTAFMFARGSTTRSDYGMHCVDESGCEGKFNPFSVHVVFAIDTLHANRRLRPVQCQIPRSVQVERGNDRITTVILVRSRLRPHLLSL